MSEHISKFITKNQPKEKLLKLQIHQKGYRKRLLVILLKLVILLCKKQLFLKEIWKFLLFLSRKYLLNDQMNLDSQQKILKIFKFRTIIHIVLQSLCSQLNRIETNSNSEASSSKNINKGKITVSSLFKSHEAVPQLGSLNTKANVLKKLAIQLSKLSSSESKIINTIDKL